MLFITHESQDEENHLAAFFIFFIFPLIVGIILSFVPGIIQGILVAISLQIIAKNHLNRYTKGLVVLNLGMILTSIYTSNFLF